MSRTVLITGSAGYLGRALREAFVSYGDTVTGVDLHDAEIICDLDKEHPAGNWDVVICNARTTDWKAHNHLAGQARQCVINIGSIYGVLGSGPALYPGTNVDPTPPEYTAAKGAMVALTRWQAARLAPVRSNCICPGGILRGQDAEFVARYCAKVPLKRMATERDVVGVALFLASEFASYVNGQVLMVDGGLSAI